MLTLITGRTIEQGVGKERGKDSEEYFAGTSVCFFDPKDLEEMGARVETNVKISTANGSVVVTALESPRKPHPEIAFLPYGPWANALMGSQTEGVGMPTLKGLKVEVEPVPRERVLSLPELLRKQFGK